MENKVLGSWLGLAVGDALGGVVRGLKPETIRQCFGRVDGYKDVRPFIGKGVKHYKMAGLYGVETQGALVVADTLLEKRKIDPEEFSRSFEELAGTGPEGYFGAFRHAENPFRSAVLSLIQRAPGVPADGRDFTGAFLSMAVPIALYRPDDPERLLAECIEAGALMSRHPWEVVGLATLAFLVTRLLDTTPVPEEPLAGKTARALLAEAADWARRAGEAYEKSPLSPAESFPPRVWNALGDILAALEAGWGEPVEKLEAAITGKASEATGLPISHPSQAYVLTLLPLSMMEAIRAADFAGALEWALARGRAADKVGAFTGALAGALHGAEGIPPLLKTGLVNAREFKTRGEALTKRQFSKGAKPLQEMELALTMKEYEEARRHQGKVHKKAPAAKAKMEEAPAGPRILPGKEDTARWRKMQKEKTQKKRDRRRNLESGEDW